MAVQKMPNVDTVEKNTTGGLEEKKSLIDRFCVKAKTRQRQIRTDMQREFLPPYPFTNRRDHHQHQHRRRRCTTVNI